MFMTDCEKEKVSGSDLIWIIYYHYLFLSTSCVPLQDDPRFPFLTPVSFMISVPISFLYVMKSKF